MYKNKVSTHPLYPLSIFLSNISSLDNSHFHHCHGMLHPHPLTYLFVLRSCLANMAAVHSITRSTGITLLKKEKTISSQQPPIVLIFLFFFFFFSFAFVPPLFPPLLVPSVGPKWAAELCRRFAPFMLLRLSDAYAVVCSFHQFMSFVCR